jgi:hypothetical protein
MKYMTVDQHYRTPNTKHKTPSDVSHLHVMCVGKTVEEQESIDFDADYFGIRMIDEIL